MAMENIRTRAEFAESGGKNYLVRGFKAMVKRVENNSGKVTLWLAIASMVITIGMNFIPWARDKIVESAILTERREQDKKVLEAQAEQTKALNKGFEGVQVELKRQNDLRISDQEVLKYLINRMPTLSKKQKEAMVEQVTTGKKMNLSGQANDLRAVPLLPTSADAQPTVRERN